MRPGSGAVPATTGNFNAAVPTCLPWRVERRRAVEAERGRGIERERIGHARLRGAHRAAAALRLRIGDADQRHVASGVLAGERDGFQVRRIDAQQRKALVLGHAVRAADPRDGDDVAAVQRIAAGDDVARSDRDAARILDLAPRRRRAAGAGKRRIGARHRNDHRVHDAGHRLIVEYREAAHLLATQLRANVKLLQVLQARDDEEVRTQHAVVRLAAGRLLLHPLEHGAASYRAA